MFIMKQSLITILTFILASSCFVSHNPEQVYVSEATGEDEAVLTAATFNQIKNFILAHGDRQTYCNMYNNNPHAVFANMDIFLNPDTGQQNINCDIKLSGFNHMVIRTQYPLKYYHIKLNLLATGPDLVIPKGTNLEDLRKCLRDALSELTREKGKQSNHDDTNLD